MQLQGGQIVLYQFDYPKLFSKLRSCLCTYERNHAKHVCLYFRICVFGKNAFFDTQDNLRRCSWRLWCTKKLLEMIQEAEQAHRYPTLIWCRRHKFHMDVKRSADDSDGGILIGYWPLWCIVSVICAVHGFSELPTKVVEVNVRLVGSGPCV